MKIEFFGQAGFCVETETALVVLDPCISEPLFQKLTASKKQKFVYVSEDAPGHCDLPFLSRLPLDRIHLLHPNFSRTRLRELLAPMPFRRTTAFGDRQRIDFGDGVLDLFCEESELDRASAIFVRSGSSSFLDVSGCALTARFESFRREHGSVDVLAAPRCKVETIARLIDLLQPKFFVSDRPRDAGLPDAQCIWSVLTSGDVLDVAAQSVEVKQSPSILGEEPRAIDEPRERIQIVAGGCIYEVDRFCPHRGDDLAAAQIQDGRYLVCPRHHWFFDLADGGRCTANESTVHATRKGS